jgi:ribosomal subunit interface protein
MQIPLEIRFHNLEPSAAVEAAVRKRAEKLEKFADTIIRCQVTIEAPHKHQHRGNLFRCVITVRTPAGEIAVSRMPDDEHAHEDAYVAIRDAFNAAQRQLQDQQRKLQDRARKGGND